ncbi:MAG: formyltetrahydrofolate deformylase [Planctomycetes bacterium]|nr:formyltetrahydrofolate deformylase [Planctomycetota bacterium]
MRTDTVRLLISCPDTRGIIAAVSSFIALHSGNIVELDQHTDDSSDRFFMRVEIETAGFGLSRETFAPAWGPLAQRFGMEWRIAWGEDLKRIALFVSKESHCLHDLLLRWKSQELRAQIPLVVSNHPDLSEAAAGAGVRFVHLEIQGGDRAAQEDRIAALMHEHRVDLLVLARYMQVLSPALVARFPQRIINIHHSFLPAFAGPKPYHQAFDRGVKIIGATSHYVTDVLDDGPIIAQQTAAVGHRDSVQDLIRKGRDLERVVLAQAVRLHLDDKILVGGQRTVVFE